MKPAPSKLITPSTRCAAKNRSAIMPTKKGAIMPAIGPTEYIVPKSPA